MREKRRDRKLRGQRKSEGERERPTSTLDWLRAKHSLVDRSSRQSQCEPNAFLSAMHFWRYFLPQLSDDSRYFESDPLQWTLALGGMLLTNYETLEIRGFIWRRVGGSADI